MAKTVDGLIAHCEKALKQKWQYVYGAKGTVLNRSQIDALRRAYGSACVWPSDSNKAGKICCDCSGLISSYTGKVRGSSQYKATGLVVKPISQRTKAMRGWAVWLNGHIGVYDGNGGYYAMDGSARNMVHLPLSANKFTHIIKLCDIDYGSGATATPVSTPVSSGGGYNTRPTEISAIYAAKVGGKNLPFVTGLDYAGIKGKSMTGLAIKFTGGSCKYRVYAGGRWLPWVTGCNWADYKNGWAGDGKHVITAVQVYLYSPDGKKAAKYRVGVTGGGYYDWQIDTDRSAKMDGYAGDKKKGIDRFQLVVI